MGYYYIGFIQNTHTFVWTEISAGSRRQKKLPVFEQIGFYIFKWNNFIGKTGHFFAAQIDLVCCVAVFFHGIKERQFALRQRRLAVRQADEFFQVQDIEVSGKVLEKRTFKRIVAVAEDAYGEYTQTITVIWDKKSFKRYNFFIDDCLFCANLSC